MKQFPSLKDDLKVKGRGNKPELTDEAVEQNSQKLADKWVGGKEAASKATPAQDLVGLRAYIPEYLDRELAIKAATERVTKTYLIVEALQKAGYHVDPSDLSTDRRRNRD